MIRWCGILTVLALSTACASKGGDSMSAANVPLPEDKTVTIAEGAPNNCARFGGMWGQGQWDNRLAHKLIVREVKKDCSATVIYAHGTAPQWGINEADWNTHKGKIEGDTLKLDRFPNGAKVFYTMTSENRLRGEYETDDGVSSVSLKRMAGET